MPSTRHSGADGFLALARQPCRCADARRSAGPAPPIGQALV